MNIILNKKVYVSIICNKDKSKNEYMINLVTNIGIKKKHGYKERIADL